MIAALAGVRVELSVATHLMLRILVQSMSSHWRFKQASLALGLLDTPAFQKGFEQRDVLLLQTLLLDQDLDERLTGIGRPYAERIAELIGVDEIGFVSEGPKLPTCIENSRHW